MGLVTPWLWVYCLGSIPLAVFYAAGLSGWFYDYPRPLFASLCLIFLLPLALLVFKVPFAPLVNIIGLWVGATLLTVRIGHGLYMGGDIPSDPRILAMLGSFIFTGFAWAVIWTLYLN
ncbi:MAG: hypothetical protein AAF525_22735, partial [Pseudomonadota bacterium]